MTRTNSDSGPRMLPAAPPYTAAIQAQLDKLMPPGSRPLWLFRVLARDERLFARAIGAGLLDRGHLSVREREIVILRVCANNRSQYEWGVHVSIFAERAGFSSEQVAATLEPVRERACWSAREQLLLALCDELQHGTTLTDGLWGQLSGEFSEEAVLELLLLASFYRTISVLTNALEMPLEDFAARFPEHPANA
jgi:alkylhydroperoxidase family enzyme